MGKNQANQGEMTNGFYDYQEVYPFLDKFIPHTKTMLSEIKSLDPGCWGGSLAQATMGAKADQWRQITLYLDGEFNQIIQEKCPVLYSLLRPLAVQPGLMDLVFVSRLVKNSCLNKHWDPYDIAVDSLRCHLGLQVPEDSGMWIEGETRQFSTEEWLVCDVSKLHYAYNNSLDQDRINLLLNLKRPASIPRGCVPDQWRKYVESGRALLFQQPTHLLFTGDISINMIQNLEFMGKIDKQVCNELSIKNLRSKFRQMRLKLINNHNQYDLMVFNVGLIDCLSILQGIQPVTVDIVLQKVEELVERYMSFFDELSLNSPEKIGILALYLPKPYNLKDIYKWLQISPSDQLEKTHLNYIITNFNELLKKETVERGFLFIDVTQANDNGDLLNMETYTRLLILQLQQALYKKHNAI